MTVILKNRMSDGKLFTILEGHHRWMAAQVAFAKDFPNLCWDCYILVPDTPQKLQDKILTGMLLLLICRSYN